MRRFKQQISDAECIEVLKNTKRGVLSLIGDWALNIKSVILFGRICLVENEDKARDICTALTRKFTDDAEYLEKELKNAFPRVQCLEFSPEHMTGKLVNES
jgi:nitroimidazol reductase NimA-like FMN-containing flavoprotein (pyridoxamine 5'-phosphate oxidase superfamily)